MFAVDRVGGQQFLFVLLVSFEAGKQSSGVLLDLRDPIPHFLHVVDYLYALDLQFYVFLAQEVP